MRLFYRLYRRQILSTAAIGLLVVWCLTASILALSKETIFNVLYVTPERIELVGESSHVADDIFLQNFISTYVAYCYNYDNKSFVKNLSKCGDFMHPRLWKSKQDELKQIIEGLKKDNYSQTTVIEGVPVFLPNGNLQFDVLSTKTTTSSQASIKVRITLTVKRVPLYQENMTHYEVQNAKEDLI